MNPVQKYTQMFNVPIKRNLNVFLVLMWNTSWFLSVSNVALNTFFPPLCTLMNTV